MNRLLVHLSELIIGLVSRAAQDLRRLDSVAADRELGTLSEQLIFEDLGGVGGYGVLARHTRLSLVGGSQGIDHKV